MALKFIKEIDLSTPKKTIKEMSVLERNGNTSIAQMMNDFIQEHEAKYHGKLRNFSFTARGLIDNILDDKEGFFEFLHEAMNYRTSEVQELIGTIVMEVENLEHRNEGEVDNESKFD